MDAICTAGPFRGNCVENCIREADAGRASRPIDRRLATTIEARQPAGRASNGIFRSGIFTPTMYARSRQIRVGISTRLVLFSRTIAARFAARRLVVGKRKRRAFVKRARSPSRKRQRPRSFVHVRARYVRGVRRTT